MSKNRSYESPYNVTGIGKVTGLYRKPKGICKDSIFGTWKAGNMEILPSVKCLQGKAV